MQPFQVDIDIKIDININMDIDIDIQLFRNLLIYSPYQFYLDEGLISIFEKSPHLRFLSVYFIVDINHLVTDASLLSLSQHCKQLEYLDFSWTSISDFGILVLPHCCWYDEFLKFLFCLSISR